MWPNTQETAELVAFTEEILNGKFHFLCVGAGVFRLTNSGNSEDFPKYFAHGSVSKNFLKMDLKKKVGLVNVEITLTVLLRL